MNGQAAYNAFMQIWNLMIGCAFPVALVCGGSGWFQYMAGNPHEGKKRISWAIGGFFGLLITPGMMKIIESLGRSMAAGA